MLELDNKRCNLRILGTQKRKHKKSDLLDSNLENNECVDSLCRLKTETAKYEVKKDKLIELFSDSLLSKDEFKNKNEEYNIQLASIRLQTEKLEEKSKGLLDKKSRILEIQKYLKTQVDDINKDLIEHFIEQIVIKPNNEIELTIHGDFRYIADKNRYENVATLRPD